MKLSRFAMIAVWLLSGAFFAVVGWQVADDLARLSPGDVRTPLVDMRGLLITLACSIGVAALLLGGTWLVLPPEPRRTLWRSALLWLLATAVMLAAREVSGWPLLAAALVALGIAMDAIRRLASALVLDARSSAAASPP